MQPEVLAAAVAAVERSGEDVTPWRVQQTLVAQGHAVDYAEVYAALAAPEEEDDGPPLDAEEAPALDAGDTTDAAVQRAQARVGTVETRRLALDAALAQAREQAVAAAQRHLVLTHAVATGLFPREDPLMAEANAALSAAKRALERARADVAAWPARLAEAQGAVRVARQQAWLARAHPALLAALAAVEAEEPADDPDPWRAYRARALWRQRVEGVQAQVREALHQAGL